MAARPVIYRIDRLLALNKIAHFDRPAGTVCVQVETCPESEVHGPGWYQVDEAPGWAIRLTLFDAHGHAVARRVGTADPVADSSAG